MTAFAGFAGTVINALGERVTAGVMVEYHWLGERVRVVWRPYAAEAPAATLPEEHKCG